jgi:hypothetical protein
MIYREMEKMLDKLAATFRLDSRANFEAVLDVLGGPELVEGESRFNTFQ